MLEKIFPDNKIDDDKAITLIKEFRQKYHQGENERNLSSDNRQKVDLLLSEKYPPDSFVWKLPVIRTSLMILTWTTFPASSIRVTKRILTHPDFQKIASVYLSIWATGEEIYSLSPNTVSEYFSSDDFITNRDYYIFDDYLKWCIAVTHDEAFILTGDFQTLVFNDFSE